MESLEMQDQKGQRLGQVFLNSYFYWKYLREVSLSLTLQYLLRACCYCSYQHVGKSGVRGSQGSFPDGLYILVGERDRSEQSNKWFQILIKVRCLQQKTCSQGAASPEVAREARGRGPIWVKSLVVCRNLRCRNWGILTTKFKGLWLLKGTALLEKWKD